MQLLTNELRAAFERFPLHSQDAKRDAALVVAKYFDPSGRFTFYATEGQPDGDDFLLFGYCVSPLGADLDEWGYTALSELEAVTGRFGLGIERDLSFPIAERAVKNCCL